MAVENPALNPASFERGIGQAAATERVGMSIEGTYAITAGLLVLSALAAGFGWSQVEIETIRGRDVALAPRWVWLAFLFTFVLSLVGAVAYRAAPITSTLYAVVEGALLGVASRYYELEFDGIVLQAVLATLGVFIAVLLLYSTRMVKVTSRMVMGVAAAMGGLSIL